MTWVWKRTYLGSFANFRKGIAQTVSKLVFLLLRWPPFSLVSTQPSEGPLHSGSDRTLHLQTPPTAPTSLRIKAAVFPTAYKALNYLVLGLISHVFQSHWLRCYSWKTPGLECISSSYLQQGVPWPLYLPLQPLSAFPLTFPCSSRHLSTSSILSSFLTYYIYFLWSVSRM